MDFNLSDTIYLECDRCRETCGSPDPKTLCYYHDKMRRGLIDEPTFEIAYTSTNPQINERRYNRVLAMAEVESKKMQQIKRFYGDDGYDEAVQYVMSRYSYLHAAYDANRGVPFMVIARRFVKSRLIDFVRKIRNRAGKEVRLLDATDEDTGVMIDHSMEDIDEVLDRELAFKVLYDTLDELELPERRAYVAHHRMLSDDPETLQEIAEKFEVTEKTIRNDELFIIKKLKGVYDEG